MRFNSNAFILSTVALLSLITPVINAYVATITSPASGEEWNEFQWYQITWIINDATGQEGVQISIGLKLESSDPYYPNDANILQSGVPILNKQSNGEVQLPGGVVGNARIFLILPANEIVAMSEIFTII